MQYLTDEAKALLIELAGDQRAVYKATHGSEIDMSNIDDAWPLAWHSANHAYYSRFPIMEDCPERDYFIAKLLGPHEAELPVSRPTNLYVDLNDVLD